MAVLYGLPLLFGSVGSWFVGTMLEEELKPKPAVAPESSSWFGTESVTPQPSIFDTTQPQSSMFDMSQPQSGIFDTPQPQSGMFGSLGFGTPQYQSMYEPPQPSFAERLGLVPSRYSRPSYGYFSPQAEPSSFWGRPSQPTQPAPSAAPVQNVYAPQQGFFTSMFPPQQQSVSPPQATPTPTTQMSTQTTPPPTEPISTQTSPEPSIGEQIQQAIQSVIPASMQVSTTASTQPASTSGESTQGEQEIKPFAPRDMEACGKQPTMTELNVVPQESTQETVEPQQKIEQVRLYASSTPTSISVPTSRRIRELPNY